MLDAALFVPVAREADGAGHDSGDGVGRHGEELVTDDALCSEARVADDGGEEEGL
jgi:hypothetical protein